MSIQLLMGYLMAARVAAEWRDKDTIETINAQLEEAGICFVWDAGNLVPQWFESQGKVVVEVVP